MMQHTPLVTDQPIASACCSIPSRYQTFVVDNSDRKGFNSGTRRFNNLTTTDTPGPGHYNPDSHKLKERLARNRKRGYPKRRHTTSSINIKPEEFQKTVSSGFSTARDNNSYISMLNASKFSTPGPNNYNVSQPLSLRKDFHRAHSSSFQSVRNHVKNFATPAPNCYDPRAPEVKSISSVFKSSSKRASSKNVSGRVPSPTHYLVSDEVTKSNIKAPISCFRSTTNRSEVTNKTARDAFFTTTENIGQRNKSLPGPGAYGELPTWGAYEKKLLSRKGHYLAISAPAIPLPPAKSLPGPGQYELVDYTGPDREDRASSMFCSNTDRWNMERRQIFNSKTQPGPASYNPKSIGKQSFIFNADRRWIN